MSNLKTGEDKRSRILKAAVSVFAREGFYNAKVENIAIAADIGKGTVYQYFSSKKHLFQEMIMEGIRYYLSSLQREIKDETDLTRKFEKIVSFSFSFMKQHQDIAKLIINDPSAVSENLRKWVFNIKKEINKTIVEIIEEGIKQNVFRPVDPKIAAHTFFGTLTSLFMQKLFDNEQFNDKKVMSNMLDIFFNGLKKE